MEIVPDLDERILPPDKEAILIDAFKQRYPNGKLGTRSWQEIVEPELQNRLYWFKYRYTPWLASVVPLRGLRVLEIGAGSGCATIPLLESGAMLTSIDIEPRDLEIAQLRAELHGVADHVSFHCMNASDIGAQFEPSQFDLIIYCATLEHMTTDEQLASLSAAWDLLAARSYLAVCDTPNRLWYFDDHTAQQAFYHWLPDRIARLYAAKTPRPVFNEDFAGDCDGDSLRLTRWGRGLSYHEFELAFDVNIKKLEMQGEYDYRRAQAPQCWDEVWSRSLDGQFHNVLTAIDPAMPKPFLEPELAFAIRKP